MVVPIWKTIQWPAVILFVTMSYSGDLLLRPRFESATMALDHARFGIWCVSMAPGLGRIPHISAFF